MSFVDRIFAAARARGSQPIVTEVHGASPLAFSGSELLARVAAARQILRERGVKRGDRVALLAPNSFAWIVADLAILAEGAIVVPLYARQAAAELVHVVRDSETMLALCATDELAKLLGGTVPTLGLDEVLRAPLATDDTAPNAPRDDEPVTLIYTSGTSGDPKGVVLTTANVDSMLPVTSRALEKLMSSSGAIHDERVFHYLPLCFAGSRIVLWTCLVRGVGIHLSTSLDDLAREIATTKPHYFLNVPALLERIRRGVEAKIAARNGFVRALHASGLRARRAAREGRATLRDRVVAAAADALIFSKVRAQLGGNVRCLICGSAPLPEEVQSWFADLGLPVYQVYGLTETTAIVTIDDPGEERAGFVGRVVDSCEIKIEDGELLVRGPSVFTGYWKNPEATARAFAGEWFRSGDAAELDDQKRLRIIGRTNAMLVPTSGHNVAPEPIESQLATRIPGAEHVVLIGHARPFLTAIITGRVEQHDVERAIAEVNASLPHYRQVRSFHVATTSLTPESGLLTANMKLRRRAIETHFAREITELYA